MSKRTKRGLFLTILASTVVVGWVLLAKSSFTVARPQGDEPAAAPDAGIADVGPFKLGYQRGLERAGFSGSPMLFLFAGPKTDLPTLQACVRAEPLAVLLRNFTPILIDGQTEPAVETDFRLRDGLEVVARDLNGKFLGGLPSGYTCDQLSAFLTAVLAERPAESEKSPAYSSLLESPALIAQLVGQGDLETAGKFVELLKEFEGETSQAAQAAEAQLRR